MRRRLGQQLLAQEAGRAGQQHLQARAPAERRELGARLLPFTAVQGLLSEGGRATGVVTPRGEIRAPVVVDAAGGWTARRPMAAAR